MSDDATSNPAASTPTPTGSHEDDAGGVEIRPSTVLPARREDIELHTADGLTLVGELALPLDRPPVATLITLHPLPTGGGFMDSHLLRKASWRLPALADIAVLRFNTRGTTSPRGTSEGTFDEGRDERYDVAAAIELAEFRDLPHRWLLGWSFGTDLALMHGLDPAVEGAILLSPPLRYSTQADLARWDASGKPVVALVPEYDDYLRPAEARERFAPVRQAEVVTVEDGRHLWVGETFVRRAMNEIVARLAPDRLPLPTTWDGPYEMSSDYRPRHG
jgi:alpha/beta superfamily hydrolase